MYDMYPWHRRSAAESPKPGPAADAESPKPGPAADAVSPKPGPATDAVQVALDRRDNGGDAAATPGAPTSGPTRQ